MHGIVVIIADYPHNFPLNVPARDFNERIFWKKDVL